jgi:hypothetical protein
MRQALAVESKEIVKMKEMKRKILVLGLILVLTLAMGITLTGCGSGTDSDVTYSIGFGESLTNSQEFKSEDGSVLFETVSYELPQLAITTTDGDVTTYMDLTEAAESTDSEIAEMARICNTFNNEMAGVAADFEAAGQNGAADAEEWYNELGEEGWETWMSYEDGLTIASTYQTDGGLLSIVGTAYYNHGGAHPSSSARVWNYDLTTGEFLDYDDLTGGDADLSATLTSTIADAVLAQIDEQDLAGDNYYFDEYEDTVKDVKTNAYIYFEEGNMVVDYDTYALAPYAAGPQIFDIPLDTVKDCLSEHMQELLGLE